MCNQDVSSPQIRRVDSETINWISASDPSTMAWELCEALGPLLWWWISSKPLDKICDEIGQPYPRELQIPDSHGCCTILFANVWYKTKNWQPGILKDAVPLFVRWVNTKSMNEDDWMPSHCRLPRTVRKLSTDVLTLFEEAPENERLGFARSEWRLVLTDENTPDLHELDWPADSGFPAVYEGLRLAVLNGKPDPTVFSSGVWESSRGICPVDGNSLTAKLKLVEELHGRMFFIPSSNASNLELRQEMVDDWVTTNGVHIGKLESLASSPHEALRALHQTAQVEPECNDPFEVRSRYFTNSPDRALASQFYTNTLCEDVAKQVRNKLPGFCRAVNPTNNRPDWRPELLVTTASRAFELLSVVCELFQPKRLLLFQTDDLKRTRIPRLREPSIMTSIGCYVAERLNEIKTSFETEYKVIPLKEFDTETEQVISSNIKHELVYLSETDQQNILFDLTPGFVFFATTFLRLAEPGNRVFQMTTQTDPVTNRACPGTEYPHLWEVQSQCQLLPLTAPSKPKATTR